MSSSLNRALKLDRSSCEGCCGQVRVIACLEDPLVIAKVLAHLERTGPGTAGAAGSRESAAW